MRQTSQAMRAINQSIFPWMSVVGIQTIAYILKHANTKKQKFYPKCQAKGAGFGQGKVVD